MRSTYSKNKNELLHQAYKRGRILRPLLLQQHLERCIAVGAAVSRLALKRQIQLGFGNAFVVGAFDAVRADVLMSSADERQLGQRQQQCHTAEHAEARLPEIDCTRIVVHVLRNLVHARERVQHQHIFFARFSFSAVSW